MTVTFPWTAGGRVRARAATIACVFAIALGGAVPPAWAAQETAALVGLVLDDESLEPISGARIVLEGRGTEARADGEGRFAMAGVPSGLVGLRVSAAGYVTLVESVEVAPEEAAVFHLHLRRVTALLDGLLVGVAEVESPERGHSEGSLEPGGQDSRTAADMLLTSVPGLSAHRPDGAAGTGVNLQLRGVGSFVLSSQPQIYLDGVRIDGGGTDGAILVLDQIAASEVKRIRILRGPAAVTMYPQAAAGVILVETVDP